MQFRIYGKKKRIEINFFRFKPLRFSLVVIDVAVVEMFFFCFV